MARLVTVALAALGLAFTAVAFAADAPSPPVFPNVVRGTLLRFPADYGAHPGFRNEWWYITGSLDAGDGHRLGFQVTFFRTRTDIDQGNPSAFAPKQILFAHAALSDPALGHLLHGERAARAGFGLAEASTADTDIVLDSWTLKRGSNGTLHSDVETKDFTFALDFGPKQEPMLQGDNGYSRKGPKETEASFYYSLPHLSASGTVTQGGKTIPVKGMAWLDHEWSSTYLDPDAVGWDWTGLNFDDGGALMAFRIRDANGAALWAGGSFRDAKGAVTHLMPGDIRFDPARRWHSPHTDTDYPVEQTLLVRLPSGQREWQLKPLFDDQELDSRIAGGPVYWEGAVTTDGASGYLELTGYFQRLKL
jgi:predicted secreted hydrolase